MYLCTVFSVKRPIQSCLSYSPRRTRTHSNGVKLATGDSVTLIKSLDVKGSQINAKIGTVVKNIKLVADNTAQIEGKIEGQQIVILTKFVRKSS